MKDATLGGYVREHERPPAFEARDGRSYTVEVVAERDEWGAGLRWRAWLFFLEWRDREPVGHVESEYLAEGDTEEEARAAMEGLTLHEVKEVLDELVAG